jgi:hypothetical protein
MARTMIYESNVEKYVWAEAVNTACYILNRVTIRKGLKKPLMSCGKIGSQIYPIFTFLAVTAIFSILETT